MKNVRHECTPQPRPGSTSAASINRLLDGATDHVDEIHYTKQPNVLVDYWMARLGGSEFLVAAYLARLTFGFHRRQAEIGRRSIAKRTGLHLETVQIAMSSLTRRGLIRCHAGSGGRTVFEFNVTVLCNDCSEIPNAQCTEIPNTQCTENPNAAFTENPNRTESAPAECSENPTLRVRTNRTRKRNIEKKSLRASGSATDLQATAAAMTDEAEHSDSKLIAGVLRENAVKILNPAIVSELIHLSAQQAINPAGLAAFIRYKCKSRHVELADFFRKAIPEDMPGWARIFGRFHQVSTPRKCQKTTSSDHPSFTGTLANPSAKEIPRTLDASAEPACEPVYFVSTKLCVRCLSTLEIEQKRPNEMLVSKCAFCASDSSDCASRETLLRVAESIGAQPPSPKCERCEWSQQLLRNTGIVKIDFGSENARAYFCECRWGERARIDHGSPNYPESLAKAERDWFQKCREVDQRKISVQTRTPTQAVPRRDLHRITAADFDALKGQLARVAPVC